MPASWSVEALKAQAIAARTYAYYELLSNKAADDENLKFEQSGAQLDDTVTYQAYMGLNLIHANSDAAILATAGRVMTYNGRIIKAYFHADSGGHTEDAVNVWGVDHPYIKGRPEVYPAGSIPGSDWGFVTTLASIQDSLKQKQLLTPNEQLRMVSINERDRYPSGRAQWVSVVTNLGSKKIAGVDFAYALGLKSPWIFLEPMRQSSFRLTGKGFGHGAGMNQWGARVMIEKMNYTHEAVLKFYYTGIEFSQL
jgi:stage II sporulation protein D